MKKLLLAFIILTSLLFGGTESSVVPNDIYLSSTDFTQNKTCQPICRQINTDYKTKVINFNPFTGITKCDIYTDNGKITNGLTADTKNIQCVDETKHDTPYGTGKFYSEGKSYNFTKAVYDPTKVSITKFLASLSTLDDDYIDIPATVSNGQLQTKNNPNIGNGAGAQDNATINKMNKSNLGFFVSLFYGFQKVYAYIQYFLFIFIGAFFLIFFLFNFVLAKMENRKMQNMLPSAIVPLLMIFICFVPISKPNSIPTTPIQETIKFFVGNSNGLADRISVIGTNVYLQKIFSSVGAVSVQEEKRVYDREQDLINAVASMKRAYKNGCLKRFPEIKDEKKTFQITDEKAIEKIVNNKGDGTQDYTFEGCRKIERNLFLDERELADKKLILDGIKRSYANNELQAKLQQINNQVISRVNDYGWLYSTMVSSVSVVAENLAIISSNVQSSKLREKNINLQDKNNEIKDSYIKDSALGSLIGQLSYMMLPGAGEVFNVISDRTGKIGQLVGTLKNIPFVGFIAGFIGKGMEMSKQAVALYLTASFYEHILTYLPLIVGMVAGLIAFAVYIIDLFIFIYLSPFIVLYAVTLNRKNKIIDFFVDGIGLFLKPLLIVISIYISLFFYYLFKDVFTNLILKQFSLLSSINNDSLNLITGMSLSLFATLLSIIISILTTYLMWKIVIEGSSWFMKVVGLNSKDNISGSLAQRVDRYSFQV